MNMNEEDIKKIRERLDGLIESQRVRTQSRYSTEKKHLNELAEEGHRVSSNSYDRLNDEIEDYRHFVSITNFVYSEICKEFNFPCKPIKTSEIKE